MLNLNEYYEGFFNNSVDAILVINDNNFVHFNNATLKMFGYTKEEFRNLNPSSVSPEFQPDGESSLKKAEWMILLSIRDGSNRFEWVHTRKDGSNFYCEVLLTPVIEKTINIYAVVRDITKEKEKELKISKLNEDRDFLLENMDIFLYRYNRQGIIQYISPSIKRIIGYEAYEWKSSYLSHLTDSQINNGIDDKISIVLEDKKSINYNIEIYKKNGDRVILNLDERPYLNESNELDGVIGIAKDVSKDLEIEENLYYGQKMEVLSNLASGFTHDVNNSLAVLKGNIEIIKNKLTKFDLLDELGDRFSFLDKSVDRIVEMLERLLVLSRRYDGKKQKIDLNDFILGITEDLKKVFTKNVNIEIKLSKKEALIYASNYNITQIFLTILVNSYNLMTTLKESNEKQGGNIKILLNKADIEGKDYWEVEISDNCSEIVQNIIDFKPIINLIEKESGFLKILSKNSNVFKLYIPIYLAREKEEFDLFNYKSNGETILIIDDELLVVKTASEILKNFGFNVIFALNGIDGLKMYKQNMEDISLTIIDMDMPVMDGWELFYKLRGVKNDMRIVVSSGYRDDKRVLELINLKDVGFIPKPYSMKLFLEEVVNSLKR